MAYNKGAEFERDICKILSLWWSNTERDDIFYRTSGSGSRATVRRKKGMRTADSTADIMATHESGKPLTKTCIFELKRGFSEKHKRTALGLEVLTILDKQPKAKDPVLLQWWEKIEKERKAARRRFSFIIFRRDQKLSCMVMSYKTFNFLSKRNGVFDDIIISVHLPSVKKIESLVIVKLDDFLNWCQPKCFINMPRKLKRRKKK